MFQKKPVSIEYKPKTPFFKLLDSEAQMVESFISAVSSEAFEAANSYLSKTIKDVCVLDYDSLKTIFEGSPVRTRLIAARYSSLPDVVKPRSILLTGKSAEILHVYTVFEPDKASNWKICGIERE